jgi:hypothetical protein
MECIELKRRYVTPDYMPDGKGGLARWTCNWSFEITKRGNGYAYKASTDIAPNSRTRRTEERTLTKAQAQEAARNITRLDEHPLFVFAANPEQQP